MVLSCTRLPLLMLFGVLAALCTCSGQEASSLTAPEKIDAHRFVEVPVCRTSIYIGSVTMTMGRLVRQGDNYVAPYEARVFPFFFYSEKGSLSIQFSDDQIKRLEKSESVPFIGTALSSSGEKRRVEGTATPADLQSGKLKIKVYVTSSIKLAFPTAYRFAAK